MNVDTDLIFKALSFYNMFEKIKVPYLADPDILQWTCPPGVADRRMTHYNGKQYVASAEQSFLQLEKDGLILPERQNIQLMALTSCYRDEDVLDETHFNIFLKLELIIYNEDGKLDRSLALANQVADFFEIHPNLPVDIVETDIGYDIMYEDLELGSFGRRISPKGVPYIYGTGLAEPRASLAIQRNYKKLLLSDSSVS